MENGAQKTAGRGVIEAFARAIIARGADSHLL
jgi:hypothetical protein